MSEPLTFDQVSELFESLGVSSFGAALPEGQIHWTNTEGEIVAHARCQAILSFAATNASVMWAEKIPSFTDAGVPCLPAPDDEGYQEGLDEAEAQELASQAAQLVNAQFLYAAPTGGGGKLFLAIRGFTAGTPEPDEHEEERRLAATTGWVQERLHQMSALLASDRAEEAPGLLKGFADQAKQHATFVVPGSELAGRLTGLSIQATTWGTALSLDPTHRDRVAYEIAIAINGFGGGEDTES
ncbi:MAG: hypothetical protein CL927_04315 [Deltaproteobacteria bacterium]|nr:hypothetical protein [Deltaproteobacteria bacterium]HCH66095.1 hypothetical protein [Deltaproteobacteria bacterium]